MSLAPRLLCIWTLFDGSFIYKFPQKGLERKIYIEKFTIPLDNNQKYMLTYVCIQCVWGGAWGCHWPIKTSHKVSRYTIVGKPTTSRHHAPPQLRVQTHRKIQFWMSPKQFLMFAMQILSLNPFRENQNLKIKYIKK